MNIPETYELLKEDDIREIGGKGFILRHKKSGAKVFMIDTEDPNKVFCIGFKTAPENDTGVPHIMEHSVLCGSEKYPVKDPFVELLKGSLNTFLNAMTAPDKTLYPVASVNDKDFRNLMGVYMDAVLHPNIYTNDSILKQEGWHYEMTDPEGPITYNGVVYNEMRGAFSDPDSVMMRATLHELYPGTTYAFESGGDPASIPSLTREDFLAFHQRFYHPSNAYIYLYGNMDFADTLAWLDDAYLKEYDAIDPKTEIGDAEPFKEMKHVSIPYAVSEEEEKEECLFNYAVVTGGLSDPVKTLAFEVLSYALLNAPGAPIRKALLDAGIGADIYGGSDASVKQPMFTITANGAKKEDIGRFEEIIRKVLRETVEKGISEKTLLAGIHNIEFSEREADYGRMPKGLIYGMSLYDTWMHDDMAPMIRLKFDPVFEAVKAKVGTDYFTELIRTGLLENPHGVVLSLIPEKGLAKKQDEAVAKKLAEYKASLSKEEIDRLIADTAALKKYQETPDPKEALETIPLLNVSDIGKEPLTYPAERKTAAGLRAVHSNIVTSGIVYLDIYFDFSAVPFEDLPYLSLLKDLLTQMSTEKFDYQELSDEISLCTGGISYSTDTYSFTKKEGVGEDFVIRARCLLDEVPKMTALLEEITFHTDFSDAKRMKEILSEMRIVMQNDMMQSGNATAVSRVMSYTAPISVENERLSGIDFYRFIEDLEKNFDERKEVLTAKLSALSALIFRKDNAVVHVTGEEEAFNKAAEALASFAAALSDETPEKAERNFELTKKNEGITGASSVQYVAMGSNVKRFGHSFNGKLQVLQTVLRLDYLWTTLRVKGGAYGCAATFARNGAIAFSSFRDPNLRDTAAAYLAIPEYVRNLEISHRDMTKYIIGTVRGLDTPLQPHAKGSNAYSMLRNGLCYEDLLRERQEVLSCTVEDLRAQAEVIADALSEKCICVVGNENKIREDRDLFGETYAL